MKFFIMFILIANLSFACETCDLIRSKIEEKYKNKCNYYYSRDNGNYEFVRSHYDWAQIMAFQECLDMIDEIDH